MAFAAVALLGVGAAACSDDEGDTSWFETYAYLVPEHLGILDKSVTLSHTAAGITGDASLVFSVGLNKAAAKDLTFSFDVVASETLPENAVALSKQEVTVPAGELVSAPVTLSVSDWSFAADMRDKAEYSIAVSLAQTPGVELGRQNLLTLDITKNAYLNLKAEAPANPKQIDRTNWTSHGVLDVWGGTQNWSFIEPVTCRYLRYTALAPNSRTDITGMFLYEAQ